MLSLVSFLSPLSPLSRFFFSSFLLHFRCTRSFFLSLPFLMTVSFLQVKNGDPPQRKHGMRILTEKARELGAGPLFNQILPLLMSPSLDDQERHLFVKVIDRVLYKLDDLVRPYVHKILVGQSFFFSSHDFTFSLDHSRPFIRLFFLNHSCYVRFSPYTSVYFLIVGRYRTHAHRRRLLCTC